jgi:site-specific recombinase XerD
MMNAGFGSDMPLSEESGAPPVSTAVTRLAVTRIGLGPLVERITSDDEARVASYVARASAESTVRAYRSDWRLFTDWCAMRGYQPLPATPEVTAAYLAEIADIGTTFSGGRPLSKASIERRLAAIVFAHRAAGLEPPTTQTGAATLSAMMRGIRNAKRSVRRAVKRPADADVLRDIVRGITGNTMLDLRDRALLTMGMMGAFRRSELVRIQVEDIAPHPRGLSITIPFSKGDQAGAGQSVAILEGRRIEPVRHLRAWLEAAGISAGAVFRRLTPHGRVTDAALSEQSVALIVKKRAAAVGYDPALFAGHSLRAGFLTEAGRTGATLFKMQEHSRHKSIEMLSTYVRDEEAFRNHAAEGFA